MLNKQEHSREHSTEENIPLFPLGIIVLPGETRFLHIFEQRYKNLYEDLGKFENKFGIPFVSEGALPGVNEGSMPAVSTPVTGSFVKLEKVLAKYPGGEVDIAVKGIDIASVKNFNEVHPDRLYPYGNIELLNKNSIEATGSLINAFDKYNEKVLKLDLSSFPRVSFYLIANSIGLSDLEKYDLLTREDEREINKTLINHLRIRTIIALQHNAIKDYYCLN